MARLRGLGRGLDALLGGEPRAEDGENLRHLAIDDLRPGKYQPRGRVDQDALKELADSIRTQGVMQPILVRPVAGDSYEIVAGERRWRAARMAGVATVPVLVREMQDSEALTVALIENIQREDLNPLDQATGIARLIEEFGMTHATAAEALGRSRSTVTNLLRLLELAPPVRELLADGKLDMGHARALLALPAVRQIELAREAVARRLSVRQIEARVDGERKRPEKRLPRVDRDVARLEEELSIRLGTVVRIKAGSKKGSGRLIVSYSNLDQLESLLAKLSREG